MEEVTMSPNPQAKNVENEKFMSLPEAIQEVINGRKITRAEWENIGFYGFLNDEFLSLHKPDGKNYQWIISDGDLMGEDWFTL